MSDFAQLRRAMVDNQVRTSAVTDRRLIAAMGRVPREVFVPETRRALAYTDVAHPLGEGSGGRALPAPAAFARLVQLADLRPGDRVLDLGAGRGYSSAVLAALVGHVVALEEVATLAQQARDNLAALGIENVTVVEGALSDGAPGEGPFDAIVVEGMVEAVPAALKAQLTDGGRLVAVVGRPGGVGVAHRFVQAGGELAGRPEFDVRMPPLLMPRREEHFVF